MLQAVNSDCFQLLSQHSETYSCFVLLCNLLDYPYMANLFLSLKYHLFLPAITLLNLHLPHHKTLRNQSCFLQYNILIYPLCYCHFSKDLSQNFMYGAALFPKCKLLRMTSKNHNLPNYAQGS